MEEPLATHVVARSENDWWYAEVEKDIVIEDYVFLDGVVVAHESGETD